MFAQIPIQHRFMVSETIAKCPDRAERFRKILAPKAFAIFALGNILQRRLPKVFILLAEHRGPEAKCHGGDNTSRDVILALLGELLASLGDHIGLERVQLVFGHVEPSVTMGRAHDLVDAIAQCHLKHVQGEVQALAQHGVEGVQGDRLVAISPDPSQIGAEPVRRQDVLYAWVGCAIFCIHVPMGLISPPPLYISVFVNPGTVSALGMRPG